MDNGLYSLVIGIIAWVVFSASLLYKDMHKRHYAFCVSSLLFIISILLLAFIK